MERTIVLRCFVVALVLAASSGFFFGKDAAFAVAVGAAVAGGNFWLSSGFLRTVVVPGTGRSVGNWKRVLSFLFRYAMVGVALIAAIRSAVRPVFLIVGVSALLIAVLSSLKLVRSEGQA